MTVVAIACGLMWLSVLVAGIICTRREVRHEDCDCPACTVRASATP